MVIIYGFYFFVLEVKNEDLFLYFKEEEEWIKMVKCVILKEKKEIKRFLRRKV